VTCKLIYAGVQQSYLKFRNAHLFLESHWKHF